MALLDASIETPSPHERVAEAGVAALLAATAAALAGVWLTPDRATSWPGAGGVAASYVGAVLVVAAAGGWWRLNLPGRVQNAEARKWVASFVTGAAWLVPAVIFGAREAWIALPAAAAFGVLSARAFVAADVDADSQDSVDPPAVETLQVLAQSPSIRRPRIAAQVASAVAYAAAVVALLGWIATAAAMTALACAILTVLAARSNGRKRMRRTTVGAAAGISLAVLVTTTAFGPSAGGSPRYRGPEGPVAAPPSAYRYSSVILLADPPSKNSLKAPPLPGPRAPGRRAASPYSISFSGEYWYYFWPSSRPASDALRKFGSPLTLSYSWVDRDRLIVQARQPLDEPIQLRCCRAIDLVMKGSADRPDTVDVELALRSEPGTRHVSLGIQPLPWLNANRMTLSYAMPSDGPIRSFDQIIVLFHLHPDLHRSPSLAIERFDLIP